jgi:hypothetical protein
MSGKTRKKADIEALIATFSAHVRENYPAPAAFSENLDRMLGAKKERMEGGEYIFSLERNLVFLKDLVDEGEALLEYLLGRINDGEPTSGKINSALRALEDKVRSGTSGRVEQVLGGEGAKDFEELSALRGGDRDVYTEKLEFNYKYFMAFRMLLFEFFGVLAAIREEYEITGVEEGAFELIRGNIEMTANYYLGNVSVGEIVSGEEPSS